MLRGDGAIEIRRIVPGARGRGGPTVGGRGGRTTAAILASRLAGPLPRLDLPTGRPRPAVQTWHGDTLYADVPAELTAQLRELARAEGATLYTAMLAAWQTLLFRHTHREDLIVGTPVSGRGRQELEGVVGYFANALPIRTRFRPLETFRELLAETRQAVLDAVAHGEYPLALLLEELGIERDPSRPPLFQTTFVWDQRRGVAAPGAAGDPLYTDRFSSEQRGANYDISLTVYDVSGPLRLALAYNTDLFHSDDVRGLARRFERLLRSIAERPDSALDHVTIEDAPRLAAPFPRGDGSASFHQERIWFIDQFETGKVYSGHPTYHNIAGERILAGRSIRSGSRLRFRRSSHGMTFSVDWRASGWRRASGSSRSTSVGKRPSGARCSLTYWRWLSIITRRMPGP